MTEPQDWFNFTAQNNNSNALIQCVMRFDRKLDVSDLTSAVEDCIERGPLLGCSFSVRDDMPVWTPVHVDAEQLCHFVDTDDEDEAIRSFLSERIDAAKECPLKVAMINGSVLVVKLHHALCDGAAVMQFVRQLAESYSQKGVSGDLSPALKRDSSSFFNHFGIKDKAAAFDPSKLNMASTWGTPFGDSESSQTFEFRLLRFGKEDFRRIKEYAGSCGSSLNALLTAAYSQALARLLRPSESVKEIQFTVDLRKFGGEGNTLCNLSSILNVKLPVNEDLPKLARLAKAAIDEALKPDNLIQNVLACDLLEGVGYEKSRQFYASDWTNIKKNGLCTPMISNFGRLDGKALRFGDVAPVAMYLVSPAFVGPSFMLSASTYDDVMTLCVSYFKPSTDDSFVEELLDSIKGLLDSNR